MLFCPKCGSIMMPKKNKKGVLACSCGYVEKDAEDTKIKEKITEQEEIPVIENDDDPSPVVDEICPECGHGKAKFWTVQTRASDEPETKFYKCEKCKHTWRDYN